MLRDTAALRRMRRMANDLAGSLVPTMSAEPGQLVAGLCSRMSQRLRHPIQLRLIRFPAESVSGMWLATDMVHYLLCERDTTPLHQVTIAGHELWHMEAGHTTAAIAAAPHLLLPSLSPNTIARIVARRTACNATEEREAEIFASVLATTVSRLLPVAVRPTPGALVRLERVLGPQTREDWLG